MGDIQKMVDSFTATNHNNLDLNIVLKFRCCKVNHFRGDTQMKKPPMLVAPKAACVIKTIAIKRHS